MNTTTITYNSFGQPTSVQGPIATEPPTTFAYDANGNLITTTDPLGNQTQRAYDAVSRLVNLTDPRQLQTQFRYDNLNRVTEIADARQGITRFGYDLNGNLLDVQDAKLQPTNYTYDNMDRLGTRTDALNRGESYQYDPAGNLTTFTDRKAQPATFQYDALDRRTRADYADSSFTTFTYDVVGRLTRATDSTSGAIDFFYDNLDRLILEATPLGAVAYEYDAIGRRTQMTVAGQAPVTYQYDAASRLTQVVQGALTVGLGYDVAGRRTSLTYPNGTSTSYTYDDASRLLSLTHNGSSGVIESLTYTYDTAGNRTSLTRANGTASLLPDAVASASYDAANQQTAFAGVTHTFDANGNLTNDGTNTYTWDARNRLTGISGGSTATFQYDPLGRRASKTLGSTTTQFLYDGNDIVTEFQGGAATASYLRSLNIDEPFIRQASSGNEHYHTDALGSSLVQSSTGGAAVVSYSYEAFGKTTSSDASANPFQFTGRENDGTGLYYYRARYYNPPLHRFIGEDQFPGFRLIPQTLNQYSYAVNDPISYRDPSGRLLFLPPLALVGMGAVFGGIAGASGALIHNGNLQDIVVSAAIGAGAGATAAAIPVLASLASSSVAPAYVGALTGTIGNVLGQLYVTDGRKELNLGSVLGSTLGSGAAAPIRSVLRGFFQDALPASPLGANLLANGLSLGPSVGFPFVLSQIGSGGAGPPQ